MAIYGHMYAHIYDQYRAPKAQGDYMLLHDANMAL